MDKIADWKYIANYLLEGEDRSIIREIEREYYGDAFDCKAAMIRHYLKCSDVSWKKVLSSLRKAGYRNLAHEC